MPSAVARLDAMLSTEIDTDKSGTLNDDEVVALIKKIAEHGHFTMPPEDKIRELLRKSDRSHDGALQLNEFTMFFKNVVGSALKRRQTEEALLAQQEPEPEAEPEPEPEAAAEVKKSLSPGYSLLAHAVQKEPAAAPEPAAPAAVPAIAVPEGHALEPALEESRSSESPYANVAIDGTVTDEPAYTATGPPEGEAAADRLAARATTERGINDVLGVMIAASALYASAVLVARMAKV